MRLGQYRLQEKTTGEKRYYRFQKPATPAFPFMLELFSRVPDSLSPVEGCRLTPIPVTEDVSSLSAILLDDAYYHFLHSGRKEKDGLAFVRPEHLIPLKARAWIDFTKRKAQGDPVDESDIRKHRNDVFRLYAIIDPNFHADIPGAIRDDMDTFVATMTRTHIDPQAFGLRNTKQREILDRLRRIYGLR